MDLVRSYSHRNGKDHIAFVLSRDVGQSQVAIDGQALLLGMAAEQLHLGADDALLCDERDDLVPEEVGIHSLPNPLPGPTHEGFDACGGSWQVS